MLPPLSPNQAELFELYGEHFHDRDLTPGKVRHLCLLDTVLSRWEALHFYAFILEFPIIDGQQSRPGELRRAFELQADSEGVAVASVFRRYERIKRRAKIGGLVGILYGALSRCPRPWLYEYCIDDIVDTIRRAG